MALRIGAAMPPLSGASHWLQGELDSTQVIGYPVLVHFWSVSCGMCRDQMPVVHRLIGRYSEQGLRNVAVHVPRLDSDREVSTVRETMHEFGMSEPCALDNHFAITKRFENQYVPAYFLFDRKGSMRARAAGPQGPALIERALERMFTATV